MMKPRLEYARRLLKDRGLIAISIDDNELYHLKLLMDGVFGASCYKSTIVIKRGTGIWTQKNIRKDHEYLLIYEKIEGFSQFYFPEKVPEKKERVLLKGGKQGEKNSNKSLWYSIFCSQHQREVWPINQRGDQKAWAISQTRLKKEFEKGNIFCKGNEKKCSILIKYQGINKKAFPSVWNISGGSGTQELTRDLGQNDLFDYPKSVNFLRDLFEYLSPQDGLILDFFAGSGTTACAIAKLNKENINSKRKFILVTNNQGDSWKENKTCVFQNVLYPRLEKNQIKYALSLKTFMLSEKLKEINLYDNFNSKQEEYINTCFCLLSILKPNLSEINLDKEKNTNNFTLNLDQKKYGFFGTMGKDLDINMRSTFHLKKNSND